MADVITRFKLETTQYDSKLRDSAAKLGKLTQQLSMAGDQFDNFAKKSVDQARALGKIESGSTNVKDRLRDLVGAYNNVARAYNDLTDEQKNTDFGKAMAESLKELQGRITETKSELYGLGDGAKDAGGWLGKLTERLTVNIDAMKLFDVGMKAVSTAMDVAKDAFFKNEQNLDDWGRTVKSSEALYNGFINALNTGDIGGYLNNIDNIITAARDAYNALDELSTFQAFNQINEAAGRTDLQNAINDFRQQGGKGDRSKILAAAGAYKQNLVERQKMERSAYELEVANYARQRGVNPKDLMDALSGSYGSYKSLKAIPATGIGYTTVGGGMFGVGQTVTKAVPVNDMERLGQALRMLNDTELDYLQGLGAAAQQTGYEIAGIDKQLSRVLRPQTSGGGSGGRGVTGGKAVGGGAAPVIAESLTELQLLEQHLKVVSGVMKAYAYGSEDWTDANIERLDTMERISKLKGESMGVGVSMSEGLDNREDFLRKALEPLNETIIQKDKGDERTEMKLSDVMSSVAGGVSQMVSGIEGLGIKIPKGMKDVLGGIQSVVSVLTGISTIITAIEAISAVDAIIPFAHGGVVKAAGGVKVPGRHFSGDRVPALLSSGESVFNMAQTGLIYNAIMSGRGGNVNVQPYVEGENILLGVKTTLRRQGEGEIVTTSMLRRMGFRL